MTNRGLAAPIVRCGGALLVASALVLSGCAVIGPRSISSGRAVYAEVINATEDEQILNVLVRQRYDRTFGMISVASVTANLRFTTRAGTNIGVGDSDDYAGNLVPLSGGIAYEENPTISYVPLSGEDFMRRMLSPISLEELLLIGSQSVFSRRVFTLAISRVNELRNPLLGDATPSRDFQRFAELYGTLTHAAVLDYVEARGDAGARDLFWDIHGYAGEHRDAVREMLDLIGIEADLDASDIILPVRQAVGKSTSAVHMHSRSALEVLKLFAAGIDVPASHLDSGIAEPIGKAMERSEPFIRIRSAERRWWDSRPERAVVAVPFEGQWFYIAGDDTESKRAFSFLRTMIGIRLADPTLNQRAPVLTVPVN